jgi:hypothetical protein
MEVEQEPQRHVQQFHCEQLASLLKRKGTSRRLLAGQPLKILDQNVEVQWVGR